MRRRVIVDTGPLVALVDRRDRYHEWASTQLGPTAAPLLTCEPVLTEACFLLQALRGGSAAVLELVSRSALLISFSLGEEATAVARLLARYGNVPMTLADACLVRMSERLAGCVVATLDGDFAIYRRHGRQIVPRIMPTDLQARRG